MKNEKIASPLASQYADMSTQTAKKNTLVVDSSYNTNIIPN
jgi:hypothetical protein